MGDGYLIIMIQHGGNLRQAAEYYGIALDQWIDLSTGINPNGWQPDSIPNYVWQRLPEDDDGLVEAAQHYYKVDSILPVAGSQAAIQVLPQCRDHSVVGIITPAYAEYAYCWQQMGHTVIEIRVEEIDDYLHQLDVLIVINPNNPDTRLHAISSLQRWQKQLAKKKGWLIVDEAFMDTTPERSILTLNATDRKNMIVLRSLGKFFGLAGLRLGFVIAPPSLLVMIQLKLGTWSIAYPSRYLGKKALLDKQWQTKTQYQLIKQSDQLKRLLSKQIDSVIYSTSLYCYFNYNQPLLFQRQLAQQGIWVRLFESHNAIRIGLPKNNDEMDCLANALMS